MAAGRKVVIEFLGQDKTLGRTMNDIDGKGGKLTGTLAKVGKMAAAGLAVGAAVAGKALFDMTKAAIDDEKSQAQLATAIKNNTNATKGQVSAVEDWISAQGKALGIADDDLRPALSKLVTVTKDVGQAQRLASIAMDVSAGTGRSYQSVVDALVRAQNGSISGLSRLGVQTKDAEGKTKSLEQVTGDLARTFKGQAEQAANSTAGKFGRLKLAFDETKEAIGAKLLPIADKLGSWLLDKGAPAAQKFGDWFQQKIMPPLREFAEAAAPKARAIMDALKGAFEDAQPFFAMMGQILSNVVIPGLKKLLEVAGPALVKAIEAVGKGLGAVGDIGKWMWNSVLQPVFKFLADAIAKVLDGFSSMLSALSNVPGFGWAEKAAVSLGKAADKARAVAENIKKIPDKTVNVTVAYKYTGLRNGSGPTRGSGGGDDPLDPGSYLGKFAAAAQRAKNGISLTPAGVSLMEGLVKGIDKGKKKLGDVLDKLGAYIQKKRDDLSALLDQRQSIVDSFRGFTQSVFGTDTGTEGSPATAQSIVDFGAGQRAKAEQLNANIGALIAKGLSKDLIQQMVDQGQSGIDQINTLATATDAQIQALNANNAATVQALTAAGLTTANALLQDQIDGAARDVALADSIRDKLAELLDKQDKNTIVQLNLDGKIIRASLLRLKRESGKELGLT